MAAMSEKCRTPLRNFVGHCTRWAVEGSLFCALHSRRTPQAAYVEAWRAANWIDVYADPYLCPLCNQAVQVPTTGYHDDAVAEHQQRHGDDWTEYQALAAPAGQASGTEPR